MPCFGYLHGPHLSRLSLRLGTFCPSALTRRAQYQISQSASSPRLEGPTGCEVDCASGCSARVGHSTFAYLGTQFAQRLVLLGVFDHQMTTVKVCSREGLERVLCLLLGQEIDKRKTTATTKARHEANVSGVVIAPQQLQSVKISACLPGCTSSRTARTDEYGRTFAGGGDF